MIIIGIQYDSFENHHVQIECAHNIYGLYELIIINIKTYNLLGGAVRNI